MGAGPQRDAEGGEPRHLPRPLCAPEAPGGVQGPPGSHSPKRERADGSSPGGYSIGMGRGSALFPYQWSCLGSGEATGSWPGRQRPLRCPFEGMTDEEPVPASRPEGVRKPEGSLVVVMMAAVTSRCLPVRVVEACQINKLGKEGLGGVLEGSERKKSGPLPPSGR